MSIRSLAFLAFCSLSRSQAQTSSSEQCNGIYDPYPLTYALDVCAQNTEIGVVVHEKFYCQDDEVYRGNWYGSDNQCSEAPDSRARIEGSVVCDGVRNCPYATVRVYKSTLNCESAYWTDTVVTVDACQPEGNTSFRLSCNKAEGIVASRWTNTECEGDANQTETAYPGLSANETCIINVNGLASELISCHERSNATSPIPFPTEEPTPRPTAGGSVSPSLAPTQPTTAPIPSGSEDDTWFITAIVFICMFGVLLCGSIWLAYMVFANDRPPSRRRNQYARAPTTDAAEMGGAGMAGRGNVGITDDRT